MVPGIIYQVSFKGADNRGLTGVFKHVATVGSAQLRLLTRDGTITIDQPAVTSVATTSPGVALGVPH